MKFDPHKPPWIGKCRKRSIYAKDESSRSPLLKGLEISVPGIFVSIKNRDFFLSTPSLSIDAFIDRASEVAHLLEGPGLTSVLTPLT